MATPNLKAYRFSSEELEKMKWLKELFETNGYKFDPNRFPEVYYDTFDRAAEVFPSLKGIITEQETPDYLGVYLYTLGEQKVESPCRKSKEGIIILFEDRIERYADPVSVRFVVLMHELGHWLTHWAYHELRHLLSNRSHNDAQNWQIGYHLKIKKTKEALAQLIAYWASMDNPTHEKTLEMLTPKHLDDGMLHMIDKKIKLTSDGQSVDVENPYGQYWLLKNHSPEQILLKLHQLRQGYMLKDDLMIDFLRSEESDLKAWIEKLDDKTSESLSDYDINNNWGCPIPLFLIDYLLSENNAITKIMLAGWGLTQDDKS
jgi:hypothetical protein